MPSFFFPCLILEPVFQGDTIRVGEVAIHKRLWSTSTFDLATLATKHKLHLAYQIMDVFLSHVNCELEIQATKVEGAIASAEIFKAMLYLNGTTPFVMPFITTRSVNAYSGINSRDSEHLATQLPEGLQDGITSATDAVEAWPHELTFFTIHHKRERQLHEEVFRKAAWQFQQWTPLEARQPRLRVARLALQTAPSIHHLGSSLLHIWQGIESLFPEVTMEVSFRLALLVAQLGSPLRPAGETYKVAKRSYGQRSKVAHGNLDSVEMDTWSEAWSLLVLALNAVIHRRQLATEADLIAELLGEETLGRPAR
jgi:hypothetical protein